MAHASVGSVQLDKRKIIAVNFSISVAVLKAKHLICLLFNRHKRKVYQTHSFISLHVIFYSTHRALHVFNAIVVGLWIIQIMAKWRQRNWTSAVLPIRFRDLKWTTITSIAPSCGFHTTWSSDTQAIHAASCDNFISKNSGVYSWNKNYD